MLFSLSQAAKAVLPKLSTYCVQSIYGQDTAPIIRTSIQGCMLQVWTHFPRNNEPSSSDPPHCIFPLTHSFSTQVCWQFPLFPAKPLIKSEMMKSQLSSLVVSGFAPHRPSMFNAILPDIHHSRKQTQHYIFHSPSLRSYLWDNSLRIICARILYPNSS